jgi:hypothetical protein
MRVNLYTGWDVLLHQTSDRATSRRFVLANGVI